MLSGNTCMNCGDPVPTATCLCPVCEALREGAKRDCELRGIFRGDQVAAAVYAALREYREGKQGSLIADSAPV